jgi:hypothetical protein
MKSSFAKKSTGGAVVEFKTLKLNEETYNIGDVVMIKEYADDTCYGTLVRIWKAKDKVDPLARVRWFYKSSDIFGEDYDFISRYELFDSDHEQDIWVVCLYGKASVLSFDDYHSLDEVDDDVFFTRSKYFHKEKIIRPGFEEWHRSCTCNSIINPDSLYLSCDRCSELYHPECIGYIEREEEPWICQNCQKPE